MGNSFGSCFCVTTFGESHGGSVGVVIDGCPPGIPIDLSKIQYQLDRRRPGTSQLTSPRQEADQCQCLSGLEDGISLGTPITLVVKNTDAIKSDYHELANIYRPSHADFTTERKFGIRARSGGGRSSARETVGRVAAAGIAEQVLQHVQPQIRIIAWVDAVKNVTAPTIDFRNLTRELVDRSNIRCPDAVASQEMEQLILAAKARGDSVGGTIRCAIIGAPQGLGEPVFDKLEADLAKAMMSLPATKGFEVGSGFASTQLFGSEHNDAFVSTAGGVIKTATNHSGGIQGGISNGEDILMRIAFKPVATIFKSQQTVTTEGAVTSYKPSSGRHDPCVLPRAVPVVESMATIVILDHFLRQQITESCKQRMQGFNRKRS